MKRASWLGVSITVCVALCLFPSAAAYAWFNDVTDSYPASQDVPTSGSPLTGADVPEGVYSITASTSSYMCKLSNVTLTSSGGGLWATFTMSGAYNALYPGTAEAAAAATSEDGTDVSAYYISDPLEGYVSRQFSIQIEALNQQMTLATYNGGSKGNKDGMWFTRTVVFNSSAEVEEAIANGGGADDGGDGGDGGDGSGGDGGDSGGYDGGDDSGSYDDGGDSGGYDDGGSGGYDVDESDDYDSEEAGDDDDGDESGDDDSEEPDLSQSDVVGGAAPTSESGDSEPDDGQPGDSDSDTDGSDDVEDEGDGETDEEASDEAAEAEAEAEQAKGSGARMREIKLAGNQVVELAKGDEPDLQQREVESSNAQKTGMVAAGALGALNVALAGVYVVGLRRARPQLFAKAAEKISGFRRK